MKPFSRWVGKRKSHELLTRGKKILDRRGGIFRCHGKRIFGGAGAEGRPVISKQQGGAFHFVRILWPGGPPPPPPTELKPRTPAAKTTP
ncbi:hypothetical protein BDA96_06G255100 [Sorghum bicolor]|uniref:Uncharacterized protein n=2 Tax=Sorghum bicolor TaxID=4558 RepID=A0A921UDJ0_SORBI|nr:hypothetical protein BDA96_06G255100 [Sorghum bicolor]KXG27220.1 hypothetical protein SORBI_3006G233200 [Sorghum bicolor]